jgi:hypothetical protein
LRFVIFSVLVTQDDHLDLYGWIMAIVQVKKTSRCACANTIPDKCQISYKLQEFADHEKLEECEQVYLMN